MNYLKNEQEQSDNSRNPHSNPSTVKRLINDKNSFSNMTHTQENDESKNYLMTPTKQVTELSLINKKQLVKKSDIKKKVSCNKQQGNYKPWEKI